MYIYWYTYMIMIPWYFIEVFIDNSGFFTAKIVWQLLGSFRNKHFLLQ